MSRILTVEMIKDGRKIKVNADETVKFAKDGWMRIAEEPKVEEPKVEEPKVEEPKVEEPKVEEPKVEEEKTEEPNIDDLQVE